MWFVDAKAEIKIAEQRLEGLRGEAKRFRIRREDRGVVALIDRLLIRASEGAALRQARREAEGDVVVPGAYRSRDLVS